MPLQNSPFRIGQGSTVSNPALNNLFKFVSEKPLQNSANYIKRGSLVAFNYGRWIHDPYPLVMVTDVYVNNMIRGINLHYLTFPYIKNILRSGCSNATFSYRNIKGDQYIVNAFRSYKWSGIRQIKMLDCDFILTVMSTVRSFDPNQIKAIRDSIQQQIRRETNPQAQATGEMPYGTNPSQNIVS